MGKRLELTAHQVQGELWTRDVGDDHVEEALARLHPPGLPEDRRRGEVGEPGQDRGADGLLRLLEVAHRLAHGAQPLSGILDADRQGAYIALTRLPRSPCSSVV